jgi:hypothetical protein
MHHLFGVFENRVVDPLKDIAVHLCTWLLETGKVRVVDMPLSIRSGILKMALKPEIIQDRWKIRGESHLKVRSYNRQNPWKLQPRRQP